MMYFYTGKLVRRNIVNILFAALFSLLIVSCRPYRIFEIETFNPAAFTFPRYVNTLLIVNNAAQQPDSVGHTMEGYANATVNVSADSTAHDLCLSLGKAISETEMFDDVRLCEDAMRHDSVYSAARMFAHDEAEQICREYGVDAFISLDKLIFNTNLKRAMDVYGLFMENVLEVEVSGELRAYCPGGKEVYQFPFLDSMYLYLEAGDASPSEDIHESMRYLSDFLGEKMKVNFIPYWLAEKRWYYTSFSSEWKRASAFAANAKWTEAETVWESLLGKTKNAKQQARLYSNLALCAEIRGDFSKAIERAEKSSELSQKAVSDGEDRFVRLQKFYVGILKNRLENESLLSKQLREKFVP